MKHTSLACLLFLAPLTACQAPADDDDDAVAFELASVDLPTGVNLEYIQQGTGEAGTVIFIHGWLDSWVSWSQVLETFPSEYRCYAPTMRGHGLSDKPVDGYDIDDYAADVIAFMDELGVEKASFVGHSMGSVIAQRLAIDHPERVDKIILAGSAANVAGNEPLLGLVDLVAGLSDPVDEGLVEEFVESLFIGDFDPVFVDRLVREELLVTANTWDKGLAGLLAYDSRGELSMIEAPTLVIWGDMDQLFSQQDQDDLIQGIPGSELRTWNNIGHAMQWEDPQRMADDVEDFLGRAP